MESWRPKRCVVGRLARTPGRSPLEISSCPSLVGRSETPLRGRPRPGGWAHGPLVSGQLRGHIRAPSPGWVLSFSRVCTPSTNGMITVQLASCTEPVRVLCPQRRTVPATGEAQFSSLGEWEIWAAMLALCRVMSGEALVQVSESLGAPVRMLTQHGVRRMSPRQHVAWLSRGLIWSVPMSKGAC